MKNITLAVTILSIAAAYAGEESRFPTDSRSFGFQFGGQEDIAYALAYKKQLTKDKLSWKAYYESLIKKPEVKNYALGCYGDAFDHFVENSANGYSCEKECRTQLEIFLNDYKNYPNKIQSMTDLFLPKRAGQEREKAYWLAHVAQTSLYPVVVSSGAVPALMVINKMRGKTVFAGPVVKVMAPLAVASWLVLGAANWQMEHALVRARMYWDIRHAIIIAKNSGTLLPTDLDDAHTYKRKPRPTDFKEVIPAGSSLSSINTYC